jgi:hypothetical protein
VKGPVSGEEYRTSRTEGREFRRQSLLDEFSISEIWARERPETGCVSAETGSIGGTESRPPCRTGRSAGFSRCAGPHCGTVRWATAVATD